MRGWSDYLPTEWYERGDVGVCEREEVNSIREKIEVRHDLREASVKL